MRIKQFHIDNGQIGGIINTYNEGNWIFTILTPLTFMMIAQSKIEEKLGIIIPMSMFLVIGFLLYCFWAWVNFAFLKKSILKQQARQSCIDINHPMMNELDKIQKRLDEIEKSIKDIHETKTS